MKIIKTIRHFYRDKELDKYGYSKDGEDTREFLGIMILFILLLIGCVVFYHVLTSIPVEFWYNL